MTNQPKTTESVPAAQNAGKKTEPLKIKMGEPRIWNPSKPCTAFVL
jgi:hypothetical protein